MTLRGGAEINQARVKAYLAYHFASYDAGDIDPTFSMLRYVCDRFELNLEQRYWLAFLYSTCYCGPTVYAIYNRFPDYETIDLGTLEQWWHQSRPWLAFQTDRRWVRSRNQWVGMVASYRAWLGGMTQAQKWLSLQAPTPAQTYQQAYEAAGQIYQMGRFALFLYLEAVHVVADYPMAPVGLDLRNAESSRNGLAYALGFDHWITGKEAGRSALPKAAYSRLSTGLAWLMREAQQQRPDARIDVWLNETSLCAFKKHKRHGNQQPQGRYVGYYLDRVGREIAEAQQRTPEGVCWQPLWDWRIETIDHRHLKELNSPDSGWFDWRSAKPAA
jgi:hypothetical protein